MSNSNREIFPSESEHARINPFKGALGYLAGYRPDYTPQDKGKFGPDATAIQSVREETGYKVTVSEPEEAEA
jgi:hypothetical protein